MVVMAVAHLLVTGAALAEIVPLMIPASSNNFTVRYTVEIEILSSTATQRRYNSSTSMIDGFRQPRAMTRRCSVMRMPVAAQRASMPVALGAEDFNAVMIAGPWNDP